MRGLSRPPSGPLPPVDVLAAGRVDARRLLRPPPLAAAHHHWLLTPPRAAATAARGTAAPHAGSRHGPSSPPPWPASTAATPWPSPSHWWARAVVGPDVRSRGANRSYNRPATRPPAAVAVLALAQRADPSSDCG